MRSIPRAEDAHFRSEANTLKARLQEGTRERVFDVLEEWEEATEGLHDRPICVLVGEAGTGKSTIASEFSKRLQERGRLGASFFFTRGVQDLNSPRKFFSTIASQLAVSQQALRIPVIEAAREHLRTATLQQLEHEFQDLILKPLAALPSSHPAFFVVVDALDECTEEGPELVPTLLRLLLSCATRARSPLRVFLTSRPEPYYIHTVFSTPDVNLRISRINIQDFRDSVDRDVETLILARLREQDTSKRWSEENPSIVSTLVQRSDGLFIYARTAVDFILEDLSDLEYRYGLLMSAFFSLDGLYKTILDNVLSPQDRRYAPMMERLKRVLGYLVVLQESEGISPKTLEELTGMRSKESVPILNKLRSVVFFEHDNINAPFRIVHATFREFLADASRSGEAFHVDEVHEHGILADGCVNVCKTFVDAHWQDVMGPQLLLRLLSEALPDVKRSPHVEYAGKYFRHHHERQPTIKIRENDHLPATSIAQFVVLEEPGCMWGMMASVLGSLRNPGLPTQSRIVDALSIPCTSNVNIEVCSILHDGCLNHIHSMMAII